MGDAYFLLYAVLAFLASEAELVVGVELVCEPKCLSAQSVVNQALLSSSALAWFRLLQGLRMSESWLRWYSTLDRLTRAG